MRLVCEGALVGIAVGLVISLYRFMLSHAEEMSSKRGGISFVLCTGDAVKHGQTYSCWREWDRSRVIL